jgi:3-oxoacyl-[acyl-carrier-protein] synthase III
MKKQAAIVVLAMTVSTAAVAGERTTTAALGAVSGAVVLGPIGAVAGAFIGYAAGPSISRSMGVRGRSSSARQTRRTASNEQPSYRDSQAAMGAPGAAPAPRTGPKAPPVQPLE